MKKYFLPLASLLISIPLLSGCVAVLVGAGVAGGIAVSNDTVRLQIETNYEKAWKATHDALDRTGIINAQDKNAGTIEATVEESHIMATITIVAPQSTRIEIKARKNLLPNMDLANKIINNINNRLHATL